MTEGSKPPAIVKMDSTEAELEWCKEGASFIETLRLTCITKDELAVLAMAGQGMAYREHAHRSSDLAACSRQAVALRIKASMNSPESSASSESSVDPVLTLSWGTVFVNPHQRRLNFVHVDAVLNFVENSLRQRYGSSSQGSEDYSELSVDVIALFALPRSPACIPMTQPYPIYMGVRNTVGGVAKPFAALGEMFAISLNVCHRSDDALCVGIPGELVSAECSVTVPLPIVRYLTRFPPVFADDICSLTPTTELLMMDEMSGTPELSIPTKNVDEDDIVELDTRKIKGQFFEPSMLRYEQNAEAFGASIKYASLDPSVTLAQDFSRSFGHIQECVVTLVRNVQDEHLKLQQGKIDADLAFAEGCQEHARKLQTNISNALASYDGSIQQLRNQRVELIRELAKRREDASQRVASELAQFQLGLGVQCADMYEALSTFSNDTKNNVRLHHGFGLIPSVLGEQVVKHASQASTVMGKRLIDSVTPVADSFACSVQREFNPDRISLPDPVPVPPSEIRRHIATPGGAPRRKKRKVAPDWPEGLLMSPRDDNNDPPPVQEDPVEPPLPRTQNLLRQEPMDINVEDLLNATPTETQDDPPTNRETEETPQCAPVNQEVPAEEQNDPPTGSGVSGEKQDIPPVNEGAVKEEPLEGIDEYPRLVVKQEMTEEVVEVEDDAESGDLDCIYLGTVVGKRELDEVRQKVDASIPGSSDANDDDANEPESDEDAEEEEDRYRVILGDPIVDHADEAGHSLGAFQRDESDYDPTVPLPTPVHTSVDKAADIDTHSVVPFVTAPAAFTYNTSICETKAVKLEEYRGNKGFRAERARRLSKDYTSIISLRSSSLTYAEDGYLSDDACYSYIHFLSQHKRARRDERMLQPISLSSMVDRQGKMPKFLLDALKHMNYRVPKKDGVYITTMAKDKSELSKQFQRFQTALAMYLLPAINDSRLNLCGLMYLFADPALKQIGSDCYCPVCFYCASNTSSANDHVRGHFNALLLCAHCNGFVTSKCRSLSKHWKEDCAPSQQYTQQVKDKRKSGVKHPKSH